jgi:hypothetical protein
MYVRYKGGGEYVCNHLRSHEGLPACQHIRAPQVDAAVADAFLTALAPAELDALSRARKAQHQMDAALRTSAERQLERKRYAAAHSNPGRHRDHRATSALRIAEANSLGAVAGMRTRMPRLSSISGTGTSAADRSPGSGATTTAVNPAAAVRSSFRHR